MREVNGRLLGAVKVRFGYRQMGRAELRSKDYRSNGAKAHEICAARHSFRKIAREFLRDMETSARRRANLLCEAEAHPIEKVGTLLCGLMRR